MKKNKLFLLGALLAVVCTMLFACTMFVGCDKKPAPQEKVTYSVTVKDDSAKAVAGVGVALTKQGASEVVASGSTDADGLYSAELDAGSYVVALSGIDGYVYEPVTLTEEAPSATITLAVESVTYTVTVKTPDGQPFAGATAQFCTLDGTCLVELYTSDSEGVISAQLPENSYEVHLLKLPVQYSYDGKAQVSKDAPSITITLIDTGIHAETVYTVSVVLEGEEEVPATGVKVQLYGDIESELVEVDEVGKASFTLPSSEYEIYVECSTYYDYDVVKVDYNNPDGVVVLRRSDAISETTNYTVTFNKGASEKMVEYYVIFVPIEGLGEDTYADASEPSLQTGVDGCVSVNLKSAKYRVELVGLEDYYEYEVPVVDWSINEVQVTVNYKAGSIYAPIELELDKEVEVTLEKGASKNVITGIVAPDRSSNVFEFVPDKTGKYRFVTSGASYKLEMLYSGTGASAIFYDYSAVQAENGKDVIHNFEIKELPADLEDDQRPRFYFQPCCTAEDAEYPLSFSVKVEYVSVLDPEPEKVIVYLQANHLPRDFVVPDGSRIDMPLDGSLAVVLGDDGYYHVGSKDGAVLYVKYATSSRMFPDPTQNYAGSIYEGNVAKSVKEVNDQGVVTKITLYYYNDFISQYAGACVGGIVPVNEEMREFLEFFTNGRNKESHSLPFGYEGVEREYAWLISCFYVAPAFTNGEESSSLFEPYSVGEVGTYAVEFKAENGYDAGGIGSIYVEFALPAGTYSLSLPEGITATNYDTNETSEAGAQILFTVEEDAFEYPLFVLHNAEANADVSESFTVAGWIGNPPLSGEGSDDEGYEYQVGVGTWAITSTCAPVFFVFTAPEDGDYVFSSQYDIAILNYMLYGHTHPGAATPLYNASVVETGFVAGDTYKFIIYPNVMGEVNLIIAKEEQGDKPVTGNVLVVGENNVSGISPWDGTVYSFTAPEDGVYTISSDSLQFLNGYDAVASYDVTLSAGQVASVTIMAGTEGKVVVVKKGDAPVGPVGPVDPVGPAPEYPTVFDDPVSGDGSSKSNAYVIGVGSYRIETVEDLDTYVTLTVAEAGKYTIWIVSGDQTTGVPKLSSYSYSDYAVPHSVELAEGESFGFLVYSQDTFDSSIFALIVVKESGSEPVDPDPVGPRKPEGSGTSADPYILVGAGEYSVTSVDDADVCFVLTSVSGGTYRVDFENMEVLGDMDATSLTYTLDVHGTQAFTLYGILYDENTYIITVTEVEDVNPPAPANLLVVGSNNVSGISPWDGKVYTFVAPEDGVYTISSDALVFLKGYETPSSYDVTAKAGDSVSITVLGGTEGVVVIAKKEGAVADPVYPTVFDDFVSGDGSEDNPYVIGVGSYRIETVEDLDTYVTLTVAEAGKYTIWVITGDETTGIPHISSYSYSEYASPYTIELTAGGSKKLVAFTSESFDNSVFAIVVTVAE